MQDSSQNSESTPVCIRDLYILNGNEKVPIFGPNNVVSGGMTGPTYGGIVLDALNPTLPGLRTIDISREMGACVTVAFRVGGKGKPLTVYDLKQKEGEYDILRILGDNPQGPYLEAGRLSQMMAAFRLQTR